MRSISSTIVAFCITCSLLGSHNAKDYTIIEVSSSESDSIAFEGVLQNFLVKDLLDPRVHFSYPSLDFRKRVIGSVKIKSNGTFSIPLNKRGKFQEINIEIDNLFKGRVLIRDELRIFLDFSGIPSLSSQEIRPKIVFEGKDASANDFVMKFDTYKKEKREELLTEKIQILFDFSLSRSEKIERILKGYKKLAKIEYTFSKKYGLEFQEILRNERIATMYADIFSLYWGTKMRRSAFEEYISFNPSVISQASVMYYDFLSKFLCTQSKIETKMFYEETLKSQVPESKSTAQLDHFLREFEKKRDHLNYDEETFEVGKVEYLDQYKELLHKEMIKWKLDRIKNLPENKLWIVLAMSLPCNLKERAVFITQAKRYFSNSRPLDALEEQMKSESEFQASFNDHLQNQLALLIKESEFSLSFQDIKYQNHANIFDFFLNLYKSAHPQRSILLEILPLEDDYRNSFTFQEGLEEEIQDSLKMQLIRVIEKTAEEESEAQSSENEFPEVHISRQLRNKIIEEFQIRNFPAFLLIDQNGIIDFSYLHQPSRLTFEDLSRKIFKKQKI